MSEQGSFVRVSKVDKGSKFTPEWADFQLGITAHGDGVFSIASAEFYLTEQDLVRLRKMIDRVINQTN